MQNCLCLGKFGPAWAPLNMLVGVESGSNLQLTILIKCHPLPDWWRIMQVWLSSCHTQESDRDGCRGEFTNRMRHAHRKWQLTLEYHTSSENRHLERITWIWKANICYLSFSKKKNRSYFTWWMKQSVVDISIFIVMRLNGYWIVGVW